MRISIFLLVIIFISAQHTKTFASEIKTSSVKTAKCTKLKLNTKVYLLKKPGDSYPDILLGMTVSKEYSNKMLTDLVSLAEKTSVKKVSEDLVKINDKASKSNSKIRMRIILENGRVLEDIGEGHNKRADHANVQFLGSKRKHVYILFLEGDYSAFKNLRDNKYINDPKVSIKTKSMDVTNHINSLISNGYKVTVITAAKFRNWDHKEGIEYFTGNKYLRTLFIENLSNNFYLNNEFSSYSAYLSYYLQSFIAKEPHAFIENYSPTYGQNLPGTNYIRPAEIHSYGLISGLVGTHVKYFMNKRGLETTHSWNTKEYGKTESRLKFEEYIKRSLTEGDTFNYVPED